MNTEPCINGGTRHAWENRGLDVLKDKLVSVKRCELCGKESHATYKG